MTETIHSKFSKSKDVEYIYIYIYIYNYIIEEMQKYWPGRGLAHSFIHPGFAIVINC